MPNHLLHETSPYLLQHANNPVDWYPWGQEALTRARIENKPIFLSIGYSACHWCHVMAHESFENPETAALMNASYINIKVDREERPDIDSIYMSATVAMTGSGGWPMSVFLTPALQPFYTGTYFPPERRHNMPAFREVLAGIAVAWQNERENINEVSAKVTNHLQRNSETETAAFSLSNDLLDGAVSALVQSYDWGFGGWGNAPKFPMPMTIDFLLRRSTLTRPMENGIGAEGLRAALHVLQIMARGGLYDVVGGGFARYSVDNLWRVPHFEKMLYDNAQLALVYLHAWQLTAQPFYRRIVTETLDFLAREMTSPEGGFYSSLDADSEHVEGKFYVWSYREIENILDKEFEFFKLAYGLSEKDLEGEIVLQRALDDATLAARFHIPLHLVADKLAVCHSLLFTARSKRIRPGTDEKILTAWNAFTLTAFAEAVNAFKDNDLELANRYHNLATRNAEFILAKLRPDGKLCRSWRDGKLTGDVFLEDYAALIIALLAMYEMDFNNHYFSTALELAEEMVKRFDDPAGGFFDTADGAEQLLFRPKDVQDSATPSGNALACEALLRLAALTDRVEFRTKAEEMLGPLVDQALRYPTAYSRWLSAADFALGNVKQVALVGDPGLAETQTLLAVCREGWHPHRVTAATSLPTPPNAPALLENRALVAGKPAAYVCEGFVCKMPVTTPEDLKRSL